MRDVNAILTAKNFQTIKAKFISRVKTGEPDECWEWQGARTVSNYGVFSDGRNMEGAHRLAYVLANGPLPELPGFHGACVLHRCDNPPCCNPAHLFVGTTKDNMQDKSKKGRAPRGEAHPNSTLTEETVIAIRASAAPQRTIARQYGVAESVVHMLKRGATWAHVNSPVVLSPRGYMVGEAHTNAKITEAQARAIKTDPRTGVAVAAAMGVSRDIVSKIRSGKTWRHL